MRSNVEVKGNVVVVPSPFNDGDDAVVLKKAYFNGINLGYIDSYIDHAITDRDLDGVKTIEPDIELINKYTARLYDCKDFKSRKVVKNEDLIENIKLAILNGVRADKIMDMSVKVDGIIKNKEDYDDFGN